ncbi:pilus assembly protein PilP [Candidatus Pelagibacter sp.]|uniref:pilus assembly protein PilP n=1 Tax=Candidatus Pelagibacter sp. TaxID=2024849 RepID=UPI003F8391B1|tara:strand:+ start:23 stop:529 length:507 start_codon:yes stop_codon:yes gene_type:complete
MTFFKTLISSIVMLLLLIGFSFSDSHDNEQNIIDKAKEINKKVKEQQATGVTSPEEPLPLNDPFVGDASMSTGTEITSLVSDNNTSSSEPKSGQSLYNFKLVGVVSSEIDSFATLINAGGDVLTLKISEELSPGVKLVALNNKEAVFETDSASYLVINFKNQIVERAQ